jgi:peptidoglycan hydrolase-like protein with peptidoglycan-binding domain
MQMNSTLLIKSLPTLEQDDLGSAVMVLQRLLALYDYLPEDAIDGMFGWTTDCAVRQFQHDCSLYEDGIVGLYTWTALANLS